MESERNFSIAKYNFSCNTEKGKQYLRCLFSLWMNKKARWKIHCQRESLSLAYITALFINCLTLLRHLKKRCVVVCKMLTHVLSEPMIKCEYTYSSNIPLRATLCCLFFNFSHHFGHYCWCCCCFLKSSVHHHAPSICKTSS